MALAFAGMQVLPGLYYIRYTDRGSGVGIDAFVCS